ncbi:copper amine oxidase N-terminal domain-containing protein [Cohnella sp. AR92]|uniref:copper amine oxidase N-terminal domain-containing protein n=1 Tax=Cohnella sp. AR92 TaxID=648716 RepID=UPI0013152036|nr:copper amine oxidase N-terminal domain-containing protein [Cohnella sp. AR92]
MMRPFRKKFFLIMLLGLVASSFGGTANAAAPALQLSVSGKLVKSELSPIAVGGSVLVPLRTVSDALGATLSFTASTNTATIGKWQTSVALTAGSGIAKVTRWTQEPAELKLTSVPKIINGRMYVPIRFLSETFGYVVYYSGGTVFIRPPINPADQATLTSGSLEDARQLMIKLVFGSALRSEPEPLKPNHTSEYYGFSYLFPRGEALRFYYFEDDTVRWIEYREGFLVATYQARLNEDDPVRLFLQGKWTEARGSTPSPGKDGFYYYSYGYSGDNREESSGQVDAGGKLDVTAYYRKYGPPELNIGQIAYSLPGEARAERVKIDVPQV